MRIWGVLADERYPADVRKCESYEKARELRAANPDLTLVYSDDYGNTWRLA